jgi:tripartite-type tricarboxylate transporter receptor subunit TctC
MKLPHRRQFLQLAAGAAALPAVSSNARAQAYPTRPVRIVVGFPAGNASDILARLMGQALSEQLNQSFIVENRAGAGSNVGTETVVRAPPDGYSLLLITQANAINASLYDSLSFNFIRDIAPVGCGASVPYVMTVSTSVAPKTLPDFIAYAKANPNKINMASAGNGTGTHIFGELFMMMTGVDMVHVPYRGSFVNDLLAGQVQVVFAPVPHLIELIRTGKLRALAVTTTARQPALPDIPAIAEFVPGYDASGWYGIGAPKDTTTEIIDKLNVALHATLGDPKMKAKLADIGATPMPTTPGQFGKLIAEETEKWGKVVRAANIKPA